MGYGDDTFEILVMKEYKLHPFLLVPFVLTTCFSICSTKSGDYY